MIEIKVPAIGESINEVTLLKWTKNDGDYVERDEVIAELESEKATFEVNAEKAGLLKLASINEGDSIKIGDLLASIDETAAKPASTNGTSAEEKKKKETKVTTVEFVEEKSLKSVKASPVAAAMMADKKVDTKKVTASGPLGKIIKDDVLAALNNPGTKPGA